MLQFKNPGKFMEDFDPERSAREMRKMNRRIYREKYGLLCLHLFSQLNNINLLLN